MSEQENLLWHIQLSPFNRYFVQDLAKILGLSIIILVLLYFHPLINTTLFTGGLIISWFLLLIFKLYTSFKGHRIRYILDDEGITALNDEGKVGLNYVTKKISSIRWTPRQGTHESKVKPRKCCINWSDIRNISVDEENKIITLQQDQGVFRVYCSMENFEDVLRGVHKRT